MQKLAKYLKNYKKEVILGPIFKLTEAVLELIVPLIMANIIDIGIKNNDSEYVWHMGGVMILLAAIGLTCALICQFFAAKASQGFGTDLRNTMFAHIGSLSHAEIDKLGTPSLVTRITNDINQLQVAVAMLIRLVIRAPFLVIGATVMAVILSLIHICFSGATVQWFCDGGAARDFGHGNADAYARRMERGLRELYEIPADHADANFICICLRNGDCNHRGGGILCFGLPESDGLVRIFARRMASTGNALFGNASCDYRHSGPRMAVSV